MRVLVLGCVDLEVYVGKERKHSKGKEYMQSVDNQTIHIVLKLNNYCCSATLMNGG
jgi:hypothetical protein